MIQRLFFPGLLETGTVADNVLAIRDGFVNFYVVKAPSGLLCFDAGFSMAGVRRGFAALELDLQQVTAVFLSHLHLDHACGARLFPQAQVFVGQHEKTPFLGRLAGRPLPVVPLTDGECLTVAGCRVRVVAASGHTAGSMAYQVAERFLFTGDALRIKHGRLLPFPAIFNHDHAAAAESARALARLEGVGYIFTAHDGILQT